MELRGVLAGLRHDDVEWRRGQKALSRALAAWRREPAVAPVLAAMKRFAGRSPLDACGPLGDLFAPGSSRTDAFVQSLVSTGLAALDSHPLGQLPLPHGPSDAVPLLVLARVGEATLALVAYDGAALAMLPPPTTARFRPVQSWTRVLSSSGTADRIRLGVGDGLQVTSTSLASGQVHKARGDEEILDVREVDGVMVVLRLERALRTQWPVQEFDLADGALVHRASARQDDSRNELIVSLLGRMERIDAVPRLAAVALGDGGAPLRWRALCEVIALDALAGVELLGQVAADPEDGLCPEAGDLLRTLLASQPALREGFACPC